MHELSFAATILKDMYIWQQSQPGTRLSRVAIRVGELSGIELDSLLVSFEFLTKGTKWDGLALDIDYCPRLERCDACGFDFVAEEFEIPCPACRGRKTHCIGGTELDIAYILSYQA